MTIYSSGGELFLRRNSPIPAQLTFSETIVLYDGQAHAPVLESKPPGVAVISGPESGLRQSEVGVYDYLAEVDTWGYAGSASTQLRILGAASDADAAANAVPENSAVGTATGTRIAVGLEWPDETSFSLSDDANGLFQIDATTGLITTAAVLDYEEASSHEIVAQAEVGGLSQELRLRISVNNVNEAPDNLRDVDVRPNTIIENADAGSVVGTIVAADDPEGDALVYHLSDDAGGRFVIDGQTGVVRTTSSLDYENASAHDIVVMVSDGIFTVSASYRIHVVDINESPEGLQDSDDAANQISEDATIGSLVGIIATAEDPDGDALLYSLSDDAEGRFAIDSDNGVVSTAMELSYETVGNHRIIVQASDGTMSISEEFTITVFDVDEIPPTLSLQQMTLTGFLPAGATRITVSWQDQVLAAEIDTVEQLWRVTLQVPPGGGTALITAESADGRSSSQTLDLGPFLLTAEGAN